jgi:transposase
MTLIATPKLNEVEPFAGLRDVLERVGSGQCQQHQLKTLLPWNWRPAGDSGAVAVAA